MLVYLTDGPYTLGNVVYARFLATDVLIVNSAEAARTLMEKRGAKYSGRPRFTFLCELYAHSLPLLATNCFT